LLLHLLPYIPAVPHETTYYILEVDPHKYLEYLHITDRDNIGMSSSKLLSESLSESYCESLSNSEKESESILINIFENRDVFYKILVFVGAQLVRYNF
jgi:hypothetical protein